MKDIYQIFDENFKVLIEMTEKMNLLGCMNTSVDLTRIATMADFKDGVLVSETLEGVFTQLGPLMEQYDIPEAERKQIKEKMHQNMILLSQNYKANDKAKLYEILRDLRSLATCFQFKCWNYWERKRGKEIKRMISEATF